jgi:hypothetical protein
MIGCGIDNKKGPGFGIHYEFLPDGVSASQSKTLIGFRPQRAYLSDYELLRVRHAFSGLCVHLYQKIFFLQLKHHKSVVF